MNTFIEITSSAIIALVITGGTATTVFLLIMGRKAWQLADKGIDTLSHGIKVIDKALDKIEEGE